MASMATMAMLSSKFPTPSHLPPSKPLPSLKPISLHLSKPALQLPSAATAMAGAVFAALSSADAAIAVQQVADLAEGSGTDNRGLALLIPVVPAILWVLYNILQPALNQLNRMRSDKAVVAGLGIGGMATVAGLMSASSASAGELMSIADAASTSSDSRGLLLLLVVSPAIGWVLFNILQPALNQINRMRSG